MRYFFSHFPEISKKISLAKGLVIFLDFDGTLAELTSFPGNAKIKSDIKKNLQHQAQKKNITLAIVSGRALKDLKNKVGLKNIIYSGNHGLEWEINNKLFFTNLPHTFIQSIPKIKQQLRQLAKQFPGAFIEDKKLTIAFHYRRVAAAKQKLVKALAKKILASAAKNKTLEIIESKKTLDIRPQANWTKGHVVSHLHKLLGPKSLGIYIGDDVTDEDAFKALKNGLSVRVGKKRKSSAKYFIKNVNQVPKLLSFIGETKF